MAYASQQTFVLAGEETTYNTTVTTNKDLGIIASVTPSANNNIIDVRGIGSREAEALVAGNFEASISMEGTMNSGALLEMFFGQSTDTQTTGDYKHTFVDDDGSETLKNTISSYTIQPNFDASSDTTLTFGGCKVNTLDISVELGGNIEFSTEILGAGIDTGTTAGTQVSTTTTPLSFSQTTISTGDEGSESSISQVQNFSLSLNNTLQRIGGFGSRSAQDMVVGNLEITGEYTMVFNDKAEFERFLGGSAETTTTPTDTGIILQATNGTTLGSGRTELYFRLHGVQYENVDFNISTEGVVEATFPFRHGTLKDAYFVDQVATYF